MTASLYTPAKRELNRQVASIAEGVGFEVFLPQEAMPYGCGLTPEIIMKRNIEALNKSDVVLCVLDDPGFGVAFEIGYAYRANIELLAYRSDFQADIGSFGEAFWKAIDDQRKAKNLEKLRRILTTAQEDNCNGSL